MELPLAGGSRSAEEFTGKYLALGHGAEDWSIARSLLGCVRWTSYFLRSGKRVVSRKSEGGRLMVSVAPGAW